MYSFSQNCFSFSSSPLKAIVALFCPFKATVNKFFMRWYGTIIKVTENKRNTSCSWEICLQLWGSACLIRPTTVQPCASIVPWKSREAQLNVPLQTNTCTVVSPLPHAHGHGPHALCSLAVQYKFSQYHGHGWLAWGRATDPDQQIRVSSLRI